MAFEALCSYIARYLWLRPQRHRTRTRLNALEEFERGMEVIILTLEMDALTDIVHEPDDVKEDHGLEDVIDTHEIEEWDGMSPCEYGPNSTFDR